MCPTPGEGLIIPLQLQPRRGNSCWAQTSPGDEQLEQLEQHMGLRLPGRPPLPKSRGPRSPWEVSKQNLSLGSSKAECAEERLQHPPRGPASPSPRNC